VHSVVEVETWVPGVETQDPWRTLSFALLAECGAALSLAPAIALLLQVLSLLGTGTWLSLGEASKAALALGALLAGTMLVLHLLWALSLELHIGLVARRGFHFRATLCFTLYSCGWDLVTSPLGFVLAWAQFGLRGGLQHLRRATRAPQLAMQAYLVSVRGLPRPQARGLALSSFVVPALGLAAVVIVALWFWVVALLG
jgi:hypothetical protein